MVGSDSAAKVNLICIRSSRGVVNVLVQNMKMAPKRNSNLQHSLFLGQLVSSLACKKKMNKGRKITQSAVILWLQNEWNVGVSFFFHVLLSVFYRHHIYRPIRTCRCFPRSQGWWNMIWHNSNDKRFKLNFRVTKATFLYILDQRNDL